MKADAISSRADVMGLALPLAVAFIVAMGYGVVLPVLPFMLARTLGETAYAAIALHTGLLMGVYMLALFLFAPLWGYVADRVGRRMLILLGLAGLSGAMLLLALVRDLPLIYGARVVAGLFAAMVLPAVFAQVSDACVPETRAQAFAWLSSANALGFLFGPALSGWIASAGIVAGGDAIGLPFYVVAALIALVWFAVYRFPTTAPLEHIMNDAPKTGAPSLAWLLVMSLLVMFGLGSFEVSLALQGQQVLRLGPSAIGWMFAECSLVMILVQSFGLAPLIQRLGGGVLLALAFFAMAVGVGLLPYAANYFVLLLAVALIAATSGLLIPALAYLVSLAAGTAQGAALGKQTAVASLGQAAGSAAAGWLFGMFADAPFWMTAGLLVLGMVMAIHMSRIQTPKRTMNNNNQGG